MNALLVYGMAATAALLWGANFNLSKPLVAEMHPLWAGSGRFVLAALVMLALCAWRGEKVPLRRNALPYGVLGLVGIGGFNLLFFIGMQFTSAVNGALIMAINPLVTALLAALMLGERLSQRQMLAMPVALGGVAFVLLGGGAQLVLNLGDALMLGANLCWAFYNVLTKRMMPAGSGLANSTGIMVVGAAFMTASALGAGAPLEIPGAGGLSALVAMALGGSVLAYLCWNAAIARLGAGRAAIFLNLVPVTAMVISAFTGAPPNGLQVMGALVTLSAVSVASLPARRRAAVA